MRSTRALAALVFVISGLARATAAPKLVVVEAQYQTNSIEGWTVLVNERLLAEDKAGTAKALELLRTQLEQIVRVVPAPAVAKLREVALWFSPEYPGVKPKAEYHPSAGWLRDHGRNPAMVKSVEFTDIRNFEAETRRMPNFTLHELAHAYHHRVLPDGFDNTEIKAVFERARTSKSYDKVERWFGNGRSNTFERAYAITDPQEYFAELTEAFFSRNDFFPFTRDELAEHDPQMFRLLQRLWACESPGPNHSKGTSVRSEHWSLQPLKASALPQWNNGASPIDFLVNARLAGNALALSPPADRVTLIRRLSFDLIGLPPSPQEIDDFVQNNSPKAYEQLVERLLASRHYGERWGRHWLDVARYTESQGFEYDKLRDNAWHYRDYVIKSFNHDKPYDRFMKEQIAGDVLEPVTSDGIIAASLLVCGAWDEAGNGQANATQRATTREEETEDLISVVGQTFMGLTINCARCHSHKFDPIPQEEYYRIKSVFEGVKHGERAIASAAEVKAREERIAALKMEMATAQAVVARIEAEGYRLAAAKQHLPTAESVPAPFARWTFDGGGDSAIPGELKAGAKIAQGRLQLPKAGAFYQTAPLPRDIREKTLEAWVALSDLTQGGGAAISIESEDGRVFDAIVFGERQPRKWIAGSSGFERTHDLDAPEETSAAGMLVHMAAVYRPDDSIAVFRNGQPYGKPYTPGSPLQTFKANSARVLLGMRHTGGARPFFTGEIKQAALHDRALSANEVAASFRAAGFAIPPAEILANLGAAQRAEREAALAQLKKCRDALDAIPRLPVSYAGTRVQPAPTHKLKRGDVNSPEEVVTPAGLSAIIDVEPEFGLGADAPEAQRRVKFAEWLADPRNPLPARVMANRVWYFHFGQGLVATPNDFGVSGARPTHPELLDWLAAKFVQSGWSVKALHRLIVNSATYRQSPEINNKALALDAENTLLWRFPPRRLEAEAVRDAMLAASGQLNPAMGGPSFRPFDALKFPANAYVPADKIGPEFNRRTVYRMNVNSGKEPLLDAFDCPDPSVKTPRRGVTTTPLQALTLMNNGFVQRQAGHLAARALKETGNDLPRAIRMAYRLALGRAPTPAETDRALAAACDRSLTNVCWALLNSTEFVYVQ